MGLFFLSGVEEWQTGTLLCNRYISFIKVGESVPKLLYMDREEAGQAADDNPDSFNNLLNLSEPQSEKV